MTSTAARATELTPAGLAEPIVRLRDVFCVHRTSQGDAAALQGTSLEVLTGEIVCVLGPSGAGKSTLLRVLAGLQVPSAGVVEVLGWDIGRIAGPLRARLRHDSIGFLPQHSGEVLAPDLAAREAVALPLALRGIGRAERRRRVDELLAAAQIEGLAQAYPDELSGGERQRLALCAALIHRPALLLADEPTGELDASSARSVRELIAELSRGRGTTVILVSHDPETATIADRSVRLRDGRVVEDRRSGERGLLVGRGGWLHLPPELLTAAGIGERVRVHLGPDGLVLTGSEEPGTQALDAPATAQPGSARGWEPAEVRLREVRRGRGRGAGRREVLTGLSHELAAGKLTAVSGPSGSGKTTLLRLLAGLDPVDGGELAIDSDRLERADAEARAALRRRKIGYLPQEPAPVGFLSAEENVVLALQLRGEERHGAAERAVIVLAWLGLADRARQRVARLSAGEAQRVALARALASARGLLIVDEPTSRLDEASAGAVAELLLAAAIEDGQTVVCATHDARLIAAAHSVIELA